MKLISLTSNGDRLISARQLDDGLLEIEYKYITKKAGKFLRMGTHWPTKNNSSFALKAAEEWLKGAQI
jgi:hypothetical protein